MWTILSVSNFETFFFFVIISMDSFSWNKNVFHRYRSAYVKHREQNHRARLPADKLFTCDICGMQFR